jgi:hypothetical protein
LDQEYEEDQVLTRKKKTLSHHNFPLLLITWHDAKVEGGWEVTGEIMAPALCKSIGWKISDTDKAIVLGSDIGDNEGTTETNRRIAIPKDWVIEIKEL